MSDDDVVQEPQETEGAPEQEAAQETTPEAPAYKMPGTWKQELWDALPDSAKAHVVQRENDMHKGLSAYKDGHTRWNEVMRQVGDHANLLQAQGLSMEQAIPQLMQAASILHGGNAEQKRALINHWVRYFGIDLSEDGSGGEKIPDYADPRVETLQQQLAQIQGKVDRTYANVLEENRRKIEEFASKPENKYFERVAGKIARLIESGNAKTLQEAYEAAIWATPEIREELLAERQGSKKSAVAAAMKAGGQNVRGAPKPAPLSHKPGMTIRDSVLAAAEQLGIK